LPAILNENQSVVVFLPPWIGLYKSNWTCILYFLSEDLAMKVGLLFIAALLIVGNAGVSLVPAGTRDISTSKVKGIPLRDVAAPLREAWMRFHESNLCLSVDGIFVFQTKGIDIWCRVKDEKSYQQLSALVEPLRKSYQIELYATRADRERKAYPIPNQLNQDDDPPPSVWTNAELRVYMRDPFYSKFSGSDDPSSDIRDDSSRNPELKRHLKLYCDQIFEWSHKMAQLAIDLPSLAGAGYGNDMLPDIRARARVACLAHAREAGKCAARLAENLKHALPRGSGNTPTAQARKEAASPATQPFEETLLISKQAQDLERRITRFFYPQVHTVTLDDLREPGLIDALQSFQQAVSDFESLANKTR
jgi:hypothetical protein